MTKEQILAKQPSIPGNMDDVLIEYGDCLDAMEEYANQELTAEREKAAKLVEALEYLMQNTPEWCPGDQKYDTQIIAKQSLTEYKKQ